MRLCRCSGVTISYHNNMNMSLDDLVPLLGEALPEQRGHHLLPQQKHVTRWSCTPCILSTTRIYSTFKFDRKLTWYTEQNLTKFHNSGKKYRYRYRYLLFFGVGGINLVEYERNGNFLSSVNETKADLPLVVPFLQPVFWPFSSSYRCPPYQLSRGYFYFCFQYTVYR